MGKRELEKMRREREHRLEDLRRLEGENSRIQEEMRPEERIEEVEARLRQAGQARKEALSKLEFAHTQWHVRLQELAKEVDENTNKHLAD